MPTGYPDYLRGFQQPSALYVSVNDVLKIEGATSDPGQPINLTYRMWLPSRQLVVSELNAILGDDRVTDAATVTLPEGFLLSATCTAQGQANRGRTFVRASLRNTAVGLGLPFVVLFSDYATALEPALYPNGRCVSSLEGPGWVHDISVANPAAGADWHLNCPLNTKWRVIGSSATLTTDATVVNRLVQYKLGTLGSPPSSYGASLYLHPGSSPVTYQLGPTQEGIIGPGTVVIAASTPLLLMGNNGGRVSAVTGNIQAGDQWSAIQVLVEEWLDNV